MNRFVWAMIAGNMVLRCINRAPEVPDYLPAWVPIELWVMFSLAAAVGFAVMSVRALQGKFE